MKNKKKFNKKKTLVKQKNSFLKHSNVSVSFPANLARNLKQTKPPETKKKILYSCLVLLVLN